jgi:hypothetical protein
VEGWKMASQHVPTQNGTWMGENATTDPLKRAGTLDGTYDGKMSARVGLLFSLHGKSHSCFLRSTTLNRKMHALDGNLMTLFLMEVIDDAIQHIETHGSDPALLLRQLQEQEDAEYQIFLSSGPPVLGHKLFKDDIIPTDVSVEDIYKGPNICHTARLPSQIRYLGILADKYNPNDNGETLVPYNYDIQGIEAGQGPYGYDIGMAAPNASSAPNPDDEMRLVYDPSERHRCAPRVHNDYKDWFMARGSDQQANKLILPNAAEKAVYMTQRKEPLKGIIALCFCACEWGKYEVSESFPSSATRQFAYNKAIPYTHTHTRTNTTLIVLTYTLAHYRKMPRTLGQSTTVCLRKCRFHASKWYASRQFYLYGHLQPSSRLKWWTHLEGQCKWSI